MISKVYELKYLKANDVAPFVLGVVKRNNTQSTVNRINYRAGDEQLLTVSCPVRMMPYVDDLIAKLDRPARVAGGGEDPIRGTGITRNLYPARFRSARVMVDVMTGTRHQRRRRLLRRLRRGNQPHLLEGRRQQKQRPPQISGLARPAGSDGQPRLHGL